MKKIGIIAPMPSEIELILQNMTVWSIETYAKRDFYVGKIADSECVVALSRIGKVASSTTASLMISKFAVNEIVLTGVAGGISENVNIGDVVIASDCWQHDMDASPLFPALEVPLLNKSSFECDRLMIEKAQRCFNTLFEAGVERHPEFKMLEELGIRQPKVITGSIVAGDQFIKSNQQIETIIQNVPNAIAVEMEGGAVGQVCHEWDVPYLNIRSISDKANHQATVDFNAYIENIAKHYTWWVVRHFCTNEVDSEA